MDKIDIPVLIVGGGPVGLTLAVELGRKGVRSLLVEREEHANPFPRMLFVNYRSMQHCRRWGIEDRVRREGFPDHYPMDVMFCTGMNGFEITRFEYPSHGAAPVPESVPVTSQICPQNIFDVIMRDTAEATPNTDIRFGVAFEGFTETADGVVSTIVDRTTGKVSRVRSQYLAACDGSNSTVRRALGVDMPGEFHDYTISVLFRAETLLQQHDKKPARHSYIVGPKGIESIINTVNGGTLWRMGFSGFKEPIDLDTFDFTERLFGAVGREFDFKLEAQLQWTRSTKSAERYAKGRAFLVGDSAHSWSPTGGFGMNTGLNDAVDLAWKLAAVLKGWGGGKLLDSYDAERRPVCETIINEARENYRRLTIYDDVANVCDDTPEGAATRRELAAKIQATNRREYETLGVQMGYRYENSPICIDDGTPAPSAQHDIYLPTSRPGHLAPHAWLPDGRSTLDLFGNGLTLLDFGTDHDSPSSFAGAAAERNLPLSIERIDDKSAAARYERRYVLVRPDGHVAWRGDRIPADPGQILDVVRGAATGGAA